MNEAKPVTKITMYGAMWCGDTRRAVAVMQSNKVEYDWIDVDEQVNARAAMQQYSGNPHSIPTIVFPDGRVLVEPSDKTLLEALQS